MLPIGLQTEIDKRWNATAPLNIVRPLIILDLVTYLLFIKRLDELQAFQEKKAKESGHALENPVYTQKENELRWNSFKNLDREKMHDLFNKEGGVISFIKEYGKAPHVFSSFLKTPLIVNPSTILLENAVALVKCIESSGSELASEIYSYLLSKVAAVNKDRQLPVPEHITKLMVEMAEPMPEDVIYDPAAGTARFLVACDQYLKEKYPNTFSEEATHTSYFAEMFFGLEQDPVLLRIGAMNMILNGIDDPQLKKINPAQVTEDEVLEKASLVLANPPLLHRINADESEADANEVTENLPSGLLYLRFILNALQPGGRAAVLVPESILIGTGPAYKQMRQDLVDKHQLEAVVSLPSGLFRPYSGIASYILLFKKTPADATAKVLFYNVQSDGFSLDDKRTSLLQKGVNEPRIFPADYGDIGQLLQAWKMRGTNEENSQVNNGFYIPLSVVKEKGYDFKSSTYKEKGKASAVVNPIIVETTPIAVTEKRSALEMLKEKNALLQQQKNKQQQGYSKVLLPILFIGLSAFSAVYLFSKKKDAVDNVQVAGSTSQQASEIAADSNNLEPKYSNIEAVAASNSQAMPTETVEKNNATAATSPSNDITSISENEVVKSASPFVPKQVDKVKYKVIANTHFYEAPKPAARRETPDVKPDNSFGALNALDEKNGYVYVVATNKESETFKGWLPKRDLRKIVVSTYDSDSK